MTRIRVSEPNPDGLDEVFQAYHVLRLVLQNAVLVPKPEHEWEEDAARAMVEESMDMLGSYIQEQVLRHD